MVRVRPEYIAGGALLTALAGYAVFGSDPPPRGALVTVADAAAPADHTNINDGPPDLGLRVVDNVQVKDLASGVIRLRALAIELSPKFASHTAQLCARAIGLKEQAACAHAHADPRLAAFDKAQAAAFAWEQSIRAHTPTDRAASVLTGALRDVGITVKP